VPCTLLTTNCAGTEYRVNENTTHRDTLHRRFRPAHLLQSGEVSASHEIPNAEGRSFGDLYFPGKAGQEIHNLLVYTTWLILTYVRPCALERGKRWLQFSLNRSNTLSATSLKTRRMSIPEKTPLFSPPRRVQGSQNRFICSF